MEFQKKRTEILTAKAKNPDSTPAFTAMPKCLPLKVRCPIEIGFSPFFKSPTCQTVIKFHKKIN
jgi:hypothetical protein